MAKAEKVLIENKLLNSIFKKEFLEGISEFETTIFPIAVVFINEMKIDGEKKGIPIILSHHTSEDIKNKQLHIESQNSDLMEFFIKFMEEDFDESH